MRPTEWYSINVITSTKHNVPGIFSVANYKLLWIFGICKCRHFAPFSAGNDDYVFRCFRLIPASFIPKLAWWRHQMETFSALLAICAGNSPVPGEPVNSPHKGQWRGALMFSFICVWINGWANNREAGDLRRYRAHYDVIVMGFVNLSSTPAQRTAVFSGHASSCRELVDIGATVSGRYSILVMGEAGLSKHTYSLQPETIVIISVITHWGRVKRAANVIRLSFWRKSGWSWFDFQLNLFRSVNCPRKSKILNFSFKWLITGRRLSLSSLTCGDICWYIKVWIKWPKFCWRHFHLKFLNQNLRSGAVIRRLNITWHFTFQYFQFNSKPSLVLILAWYRIRRQAIMWTNDGLL